MIRPRRFGLAVLLTLTVAGCTLPGSSAAGTDATPTPAGPASAGTAQPGPLAVSTSTSTVYPAHCQARDNNEEPDPTCTPGALNPAVTQATIGSTICTSGWTATIRPPTSYTNKIKREAIAAYGNYAGTAMGSYELDHLISLEIGGSPTAVANLWPEKGEHNDKDPVENAAKVAVCSGKMTLIDVQQQIATNWVALGHELGVTGIPAT
ncbi:hypothetical protein I6A60_30835 [Frankia sp. AgB1.9]|uniref:hypothetical protein n=1 Tax=unclassified Frankia TaxID=2632575 RepID=UPI00193168A4|nr:MULTISPECIES: hypothetical protein [unclassified Frankia]MBL7490817.1 hypothetical protein [Frankia sp. AgW1.1]MBL7552226.1 hypothetical protein [Frankia sp. AgB1.9]MBL7622016.1 hypothetical protein [Frankia sp. AgB1.8]